MGCCPEKNKLL